MKATRKAARQKLKDATLAEYTALCTAANLTPTQRRILDLYICRENSVSKIAMELFCCEASVRKHLARAYDKVSKS